MNISKAKIKLIHSLDSKKAVERVDCLSRKAQK